MMKEIVFILFTIMFLILALYFGGSNSRLIQKRFHLKKQMKNVANELLAKDILKNISKKNKFENNKVAIFEKNGKNSLKIVFITNSEDKHFIEEEVNKKYSKIIVRSSSGGGFVNFHTYYKKAEKQPIISYVIGKGNHILLVYRGI